MWSMSGISGTKPTAPARSAPYSRATACRRQLARQAPMLWVQVLEHHPLVAVQPVDALIFGRGLEVAPIEVDRDLRDARIERRALGASEELLAAGERRRQRRETRGAFGGAIGIKNVGRFADARPEARAERVVRVSDASVGVLVIDRHALEGLRLSGFVALTVDRELLVEELLVRSHDRQAHGAISSEARSGVASAIRMLAPGANVKAVFTATVTIS
jgi:hypothetical protein